MLDKVRNLTTQTLEHNLSNADYILIVCNQCVVCIFLYGLIPKSTDLKSTIPLVVTQFDPNLVIFTLVQHSYM